MGNPGDHVHLGLLVFPVFLLLLQKVTLHIVECSAHGFELQIAPVFDVLRQIVFPDSLRPIPQLPERFHDMNGQIAREQLADQEQPRNTQRAVREKQQKKLVLPDRQIPNQFFQHFRIQRNFRRRSELELHGFPVHFRRSDAENQKEQQRG